MANAGLDKLFSEYEVKKTNEEAARKGLAENTERFGQRLVSTVLPALGSLGAELCIKGCKVEIKSAGPGTNNENHLEHSSATIRIWPPNRHAEAVAPFEGTFSSASGTFDYTRSIGTVPSNGTRPANHELWAQDAVDSLVLELFRDVLLNK